MQGLKVIVKGKVQGVSYRANAKKMAVQLKIKGWVKNNIDGSVQMELYGDESDLEAMLRWCNKGTLLSRVDAIQIEEIGFNGKLENFEIIYE